MTNLELIMNMLLNAGIDFEVSNNDDEGYFIYVRSKGPSGLICFSFAKEGRNLLEMDFIIDIKERENKNEN